MKWLFTRLGFFIIKCILDRHVIATYHGIKLCDVNCEDNDDRKFIKYTKEALDLIARVDPRRFSRVRKELRYIINQELISGGAYFKECSSCAIDFGRYKFDKNYEWYLCQYSGAIIHEATHSYLDSRGIFYNAKNRARIERICHGEQNRFFKKLDYEFTNDLVTEFDEKKWNGYWHNSKWQKIQTFLKRITQKTAKINARHQKQI